MAKANRANSPISTTADIPVDPPVVTAADTPSDAPVVTTADATVDAPVDTPVDAAVVTAADAPVYAPVDTLVDAPAYPPIDAAVDTPVEALAAEPALIKVRVLAHCVYGKPDDVVQLDAVLVPSLAGVVDAAPAAVAYAESQAG